MNLKQFQVEAAKTDQTPSGDEHDKLIPLLGMAGEVGTLISEYKKHLRDGTAHQSFEEHVSEELGDILWYLANLATKFDLCLEEIASSNLSKIESRWSSLDQSDSFFDDTFPQHEQLPRELEIRFEPGKNEVGVATATMFVNGNQVGDELTDNAHDDDGYRFHDIFHFAHMVGLGWSPVMRKLMKIKRASDPKVDEVEDGARAGIVEELISQLVYNYAREHQFLAGVNRIDFHLLKTVKSLVIGREVEVCSLAQWERTILNGYDVWRKLRDNNGGGGPSLND